MRVSTHFVHPLVEDQSEQPAFPDVEEFEQFPMGDLFAHFSTDDLNLLQP